nr:transporter substrate-binding domain-containing protein [uncultured Roseateles sp.]
MRLTKVKRLIALTLAVMALACQASGCTEISYAANANYPPYSWTTDGLSYRGASKDLLDMVLPAGVALKPVIVPWVRTLAMAERGQIDLLLSLRITPEREKYLNFFPAPAFANSIVVFVLKDSPLKTADWALMRNFRGGLSRGDTFGNGFDDYLKQYLSVEEAVNMVNNFKKLSMGRIDYFVTGEYLGRAYLSNNPDKEVTGIVALQPPISSGSIHFAFTKDSPCNGLAVAMNARLAELIRQGVPAKLLNEALKRFAAEQQYLWR